MKTTTHYFAMLLAVFFVLDNFNCQAQQTQIDQNKKIDYRIDNMGYWKRMANKGLIPFNPSIPIAPAVSTDSEIKSLSVATEDSQDVPVTIETNIWESENSTFVDPSNSGFLLNSNNSAATNGSTTTILYGACYLLSDDAGLSWGGSYEGAGGENWGDPATGINLDGTRMYVNFINSQGGQSVAHSTDGGNTWEAVVVATVPNPESNVLDKNHMWIDNSSASPHNGNLYVAWTPFAGIPNDGNIEFSRSIDGGLTWSVPINVSSETSGFHQGVNISTGPDGEVYVIWTIYDGASDEAAIGFAKSTDGGETFEPAVRIIDNIRGIRGTGVGKNMRVNSFPVITSDISSSDYNGNIYVVWTNIGIPGVNTGTGSDVYVIISEDGGSAWSSPTRVNQDTPGQGKVHYLPWITCDPETGYLSTIFYDDRNVGSNQCEVYCANSVDGGETWEDFKVSDVAFTISPIPGLVGDYMGDYISITARGGKVYPVWTDSRDGFMTWVSPYEINTLSRPENLVADINQENGEVSLSWDFEEKDFQHFNIYRENELLGTTTETSYMDNLPQYGNFTFRVTAVHDEGESTGPTCDITWGSPTITITPGNITESLSIGETSVKNLIINNIGQIQLDYSITIEEQENSMEDIDWLQVDPANGEIGAGENDTVAVGFDATDMEPGNYTANLKVSSNDPDDPITVIPVTLNILVTKVGETMTNIVFDVCPNPNNGIFSFEVLSEEINKARISIYNTKGEIVYEQKKLLASGKHTVTMDMSSFSNGIYFANISNNEISITRKFIIKK
jgi:hypothetical protein